MKYPRHFPGVEFEPFPRTIRFQDLTGRRFGRLLVVGYRGDRKWFCFCDCGETRSIYSFDLKRGNSTSCGCFTRERCSTHSCSSTSAYSSWRAMIARCYDIEDKSYSRYGGRGITVCERWRDPVSGPQNFLQDLGHRKDGMSLDRINVNGNYEPSNCRWASDVEQQRNKSSNRNLSYLGRTQCLTAWAQEFGIHWQTLRNRLKAGWELGTSLSTPVRKFKS